MIEPLMRWSKPRLAAAVRDRDQTVYRLRREAEIAADFIGAVIEVLPDGVDWDRVRENMKAHRRERTKPTDPSPEKT